MSKLRGKINAEKEIRDRREFIQKALGKFSGDFKLEVTKYENIITLGGMGVLINFSKIIGLYPLLCDKFDLYLSSKGNKPIIYLIKKNKK